MLWSRAIWLSMQVQECVVGDTGRLERLIRRKSNARQPDRFRMVLFALRG